MKREASSLECICKIFKGLSAEKKDCVLYTARSLLKIQDINNFSLKKDDFTFLETSPAYADEKNI